MAVRVSLLAAALLVAVSCFHATASDPSLLQDFCVVDKMSKGTLRVNGFPCKDANDAMVEDFFFSGLHMAGNTTNKQGSAVTPVNVAQIAALNTMGISLARIDYAPFGQNPPHTHPRGTEILTVLEGSLYVGFVTSNPDNKLFTKVLNKGDVFVFPQGLIHFQFNYGTKNAVALAALSSQNPGVITVANSVFGSKPSIPDDILAKAFQVDKMTVDRIQAQF
ncbi:putative germin-like protein 2-1 isoform X2 [Panicum virgatum]|uniref:putative germin-like protein 2-1 isoform X2 n=1 Tax=Panicum virgatum TaxID=38727 RepID=UPI0019D655D1|nr:putative germin-like protein 2-1 isoform X2 [Panicum virgatum]